MQNFSDFIMKCAIFEEHSSSCVVYSRFSGTLFPVSMIDGEEVCCEYLPNIIEASNLPNIIEKSDWFNTVCQRLLKFQKTTKQTSFIAIGA